MYHGEDFIKDAEDKYNAKANKTLSDNIDTIKFNLLFKTNWVVKINGNFIGT